MSIEKMQELHHDSIFEIGKEQTLTNVQTPSKTAFKELERQYQTAAKEQENQNLKTLNDKLQYEKIAAIIACSLFIFLMVLLLINNRKTRKINAELQVEKKIVERQAKEKEMLVHEIHHRVKNNLTTLKGLLYLQARSASDDETKRILEECQTRIQSMALVHHNLYDEKNAGKLDFVSFLDSMFDELCNSFRRKHGEIQFNVIGQCNELNIVKAIPLGLVMNELVTNSIKYAFLQQDDGSIQINISQTNHELMIEYLDSGPGLAKEFNLQKGGFGFKLIHILSQQLQAKISYELKDGHPVFTLKVAL